jgi:lysozyme
VTYTTGIIDVAHWETDSIPHLADAKADGLVAVIAKCTQGKDAIDRAYPKFAVECRRLGLLFGSYHFGSGTSPGEQQADWYLRHADHDSLHALDWEWQINVDRATGKKFPDMSVAQAEAFVTRIHEKTGRWPLVYTSRAFLTKSLRPSENSVLANCPLWLCWYLDAKPEKHLPLAPWKTWDLWQYTNGKHAMAKPPGPIATPHLGGVDRNAFAGDESALREWWMNSGRACRP